MSSSKRFSAKAADTPLLETVTNNTVITSPFVTTSTVVEPVFFQSPPQSKRIDEVYHALKTIGSIKVGDKLATRSGALYVMTPNYHSSLFRTLFRENRNRNIDTVSEILQAAFDMMHSVVHKQEQEQQRFIASNNTTSRVRCILDFRNRQFIERTRTAIAGIRPGLQNLSKTYESDQLVMARIELLLERIDDQLKEVDISLSFFQGQATGGSVGAGE
jgi:hypothetical protein